MSELQTKPLDRIAIRAQELAQIQARISELNAEMKDLSSKKEQISTDIVADLKDMGDDEAMARGFILEGIGVLKLDTKPYPRVIDLQGFVGWGSDNGQMLPPLTVNPTTFSSWYSEQSKLNLPLPPKELVDVFWKTSCRINKRA